ncbi:MAG: glycosyltransferase family 4 protein [Campylobacterota bacterium]|nr:glycosyltransferase family 4 protein [Campylobacterota bacterium]
MSKKKIALVNVFFHPQSIGGATRVLEDNFNVLVDKYGEDFELVVFTSDVEMQDKPHTLDSYMYKGIRVYRSSIIFREKMDWHPKDEEMKILFEKFLNFEKPDYVHYHCVQRLSASVVEASLEKKVPYFITLHDAWWISDFQFLVDPNGKVYPNGHIDPFEDVVLPNNVTLDESIKRKIYLKKLLRGAKKIFSVSQSFKELYEKNDIQNIVVTQNGISNSVEWKEKDTSYSEKVVCGHIGGMSEHKGYDILKTAVLNTQAKNLEFLVIDHSKDDGYTSKEMWGDVPVTFKGRVKQDGVVELYRQIDVLFAPSIWPESFGLVTREAVRCGCWVATSNLGGIGEDITKESGFVIEPTVVELEKVLKTIDARKTRYKSIVKDSRTRLADEQVKELVGYYGE